MVAVVMQAPLNRIAVAIEVLPKEVCYEDALVPSVKAVQTAVGVLFEHREEGAVVLVAVIAQRPKEARAQIIVGKNKASKIGNKRLDTRPHRDEIEVWAQVPELHFRESLFQRDLRVGAISAAPHIDIDDAVFARVHIVGYEIGRA